ncbi:hypothetical protein LMG10661_02836 [Ralstonia syzygii subsp. syzygii]|nr:hypothetical protein LMG10661_02836 [Ralstonia syzygii subsp. syzygii]
MARCAVVRSGCRALRAGGRYRCVWRNAEGVEMGTGGTYREIVRPERLVRTERFDQDWTGGETLCTAVLTERDGVTTLDTTVRYSTMRAPDGALASGMEKGIAHSYDRMEVLLQEQAACTGPGRDLRHGNGARLVPQHRGYDSLGRL